MSINVQFRSCVSWNVGKRSQLKHVFILKLVCEKMIKVISQLRKSKKRYYENLDKKNLMEK